MANIRELYEHERKCGFRKPGGTYLIGSKSSAPCCKLPFPLSQCFCCGNTIKFNRGLQWINTTLFKSVTAPCKVQIGSLAVNHCLLSEYSASQEIGLMWVGEKFYPMPRDFSLEADNLGVSKRLGSVHSKIIPGKTWVALAHNKALYVPTTSDGQPGAEAPSFAPGIFMLFLVTSIQYVVTGEETEEELTILEEKGYELVRVSKAGQQTNLYE